MAITFDTLEYVNELKAADVSDKQAQAQAKAMRRVLDTALAEQARAVQAASERAAAELDTKTERAVARLDAKIERTVAKLDAKIDLVRSELRGEQILLRWMLAATLAMVGGIFAKLFWG